LTAAGIAAGEALSLGARAGGGAGTILKRADVAVTRGARLSVALGASANLTDADRALLEAGERCGALARSLELLCARLDQTAGVWSRIGRTLAYPLCLLCLTFAVVVAMGALVLPAFADLYGGEGVPLPLATRALLIAGSAATGRVLPACALAALGAVVYLALSTNREVRRRCDSSLLRLPLLGKTIAATILSDLYATLAGLLAAGVELDQALRLAAPTATSSVVRARLERTHTLVARGSVLSTALLQSGLDPVGKDAALVRMAEATGDYAGCFARLAGLAATVRDERTAALTRLLEPAAVAIMALGVAATVLGVYQPILGATDLLLGDPR
jgi:general secretion pathway protein F